MRRLRDASHVHRLLWVETRSCPQIHPLRGRHPIAISPAIPASPRVRIPLTRFGWRDDARMRRPWRGPEGRDCPKPRALARGKPIGGQDVSRQDTL